MSFEGPKPEKTKEELLAELDVVNGLVNGLYYYISSRKNLELSQKLDPLFDVVNDMVSLDYIDDQGIEKTIEDCKEMLEKLLNVARANGVSEEDVTMDKLDGYAKMSHAEGKAFDERREKNLREGITPEETLLQDIFKKDKLN